MAVPEVPDFNAGVLTTTDMAKLAEAVVFLQDRPTVQLRQTASQNLTTSAWTSITFTTGEDIDSHNGHDTATNTSRYVLPEDGWYEVGAAIAIESNATGIRAGRWAKNGTAVSGSVVEVPAVSGGPTIYVLRTMKIFGSAGDYIEAQGWQNSGGTRATDVVAEEQSNLSGFWLRRL